MTPFFLNIWMEIADKDLAVRATPDLFAFTAANDDQAAPASQDAQEKSIG